ncbi:hypothetical protein L873DRAFT_1839910 [Choiromyces venosus 120613-1]|uniref:Uncharacterized protein n=1 Tax=Choiromyces venosus 120613-1 TaxID=1336337 RepID=A0A3N4K467_9PEZI|nr:hypothetical protein L873DRAFT_1839910 [Choiromyces venosus 120613-1]
MRYSPQPRAPVKRSTSWPPATTTNINGPPAISQTPQHKRNPPQQPTTPRPYPQVRSSSSGAPPHSAGTRAHRPVFDAADRFFKAVGLSDDTERNIQLRQQDNASGSPLLCRPENSRRQSPK